MAPTLVRLFRILTAVTMTIAACGGTVATPSPPASAASAAATAPSAPVTPAPVTPAPVKVTWDLVLNVALTHPLAAYFKDFAAAVQKRTNGQLTLTLRPVGELPYAQDTYVQAVGRGSVQIANASSAFVTTSKAAAMPNLPFLIRTKAELDTAMPIVVDAMNKELSDQGVKMLFYYSFPSQQIFGSGPAPLSLRDLKGRKLRSSSAEQAHFLQQFGATPVSLTSSDVPTALERGVVGGSITSAFNAVGGNLTTYFKWAYILNINMAPSYIIANTKAYEALPADVRRVLDEESARTQRTMLESLEQEEVKDLSDMKAKGVAVVEATPADVETAVKEMTSFWTEWGQKAGPSDAAALQQVRAALKK